MLRGVCILRRGSLCAHRLSACELKPGLRLPNGRKGPWPPTLLPLSAEALRGLPSGPRLEPLCRPSVATPGQGPGWLCPLSGLAGAPVQGGGPALLSPPHAPISPEPVLLLGKEPARPSLKLCSGLGVAPEAPGWGAGWAAGRREQPCRPRQMRPHRRWSDWGAPCFQLRALLGPPFTEDLDLRAGWVRPENEDPPPSLQGP